MSKSKGSTTNLLERLPKPRMVPKHALDVDPASDGLVGLPQ